MSAKTYYREIARSQPLSQKYSPKSFENFSRRALKPYAIGYQQRVNGSQQMSVVVATLYKFVPLKNVQALQVDLLEKCRDLGLRGTLLLATEGINGTVAGDRDGIDGILEFLRQREPKLSTLQVRESLAETLPFQRLKIKIKPEIVTFGIDGIQPAQRTGQHVPPKDWNALISDPDVVVIDTRNQFEVGMGSFEGALDPETRGFRDFPEQVQRLLGRDGDVNGDRRQKVAMFCTGGIRCEKASAYLLDQGVEEVYQLEGGILNYLEQIPPEESLWRGECFVFDERVTLTHGLQTGGYSMCKACGMPVSQEEQRSPQYQPDVQCSHCTTGAPANPATESPREEPG
ncbi:MAG: rhodanese-related sulfurtransferase [Cyanobacteria bacterium P01_D01_bin.73]